MLQPPCISDSAKAWSYIQEGRVVAFPTGTTYGLAVDALQGHALQRLRNLKQRPIEKTFTVFMNPEILSSYVVMTASERQFIDQYAGEAVTILLKPTSRLEHLSQSGLVGLRLIDHPLMKDLADLADVPLTATSANISNGDACLTPDCIQRTFLWEDDNSTFDLSLAAILDGGKLPLSLPSTIIKLNGEAVHVIRPGVVKL